MSRTRNGTLSLRKLASAGKPALEALVSGATSIIRVLSSGASDREPWSTGLSCAAAGCSSSISGLVVCANVPSRLIVASVSLRKAGKARIVSARSVSRRRSRRTGRWCCARSSAASTGERSAPRTPGRRRAAASWWRRSGARSTASTESTLVANGIELGEGLVELLAAVGQRDPALLHPGLERLRGSWDQTRRRSGRAARSATPAPAAALRRRAASGPCGLPGESST